MAQLNPMRYSHVAKFDRERLAREDHGHPMMRVAMPGRGLAGQKTHAPDENRAAPLKHLFRHDSFLPTDRAATTRRPALS